MYSNMFVENCITLHMNTESQCIYPQRSKVTVILEVKHSRIPWADPGQFPWVRGFKNRDKISLNKVDVLLHLYIIIHFTDLSHNYTLLNPFKYDIQSACEYNY